MLALQTLMMVLVLEVKGGVGRKGVGRAREGGGGGGVVAALVPHEIEEAQAIEAREGVEGEGEGTLEGGGGVRAAERGEGDGRRGGGGGAQGGAGEADGSRRGGGPSAGLPRVMFATDVARM